MTVPVAVTLDIGPQLIARIEAVHASLQVRALGVGQRATFGARLPYPTELQARTPRDELLAALAGSEVLFSAWAGDLPDLDLRQVAPRVRWVQLTHAGAERVQPALVGDVVFTSAGGMSSGPIAEWVISAMLLFAKGWPDAQRRQQAHDYARYMPREVAGTTVGLIGLGQIGTEVARRARALGCRVLAMRRSFSAGDTHPEVDEAVPPSELDYLLGASDYLVLAAPLTAETRGIIDARALGLMRRNAVLINVARGPLVDEAALVAALHAGMIGGAALDVFATEPLPADSPLWDAPRLSLTPHVAAGTDRYYERATEVFCANLVRYLAGEPLLNVVDFARGY